MLADVLAKGNRMADLTYEEAVLDACMTSWIDPAGKTPKEILHALMMWEQQLALDPLVSEVAADWKRRADLGDAAMALRDQEVALSGRLRERAEKAEERLWAARENLKRAVGILQEVKRSGLPDESIDPRFHLGSQVWVVCDDIEKSLKSDATPDLYTQSECESARRKT